VHALLALFLGAALLGVTAGYLASPLWLAAAADALEAERPIDDPDALVLRSNGRSAAAEDVVSSRLGRGEAQAVVPLGRPFTPDDQAPAAASPNVARLLARGIPREAIVEIYLGEDLYEETEALARAARDRDWRRVLFVVPRGGTRRALLAADRALGREGIEVGLIQVPSDDPEDVEWWRDPQQRGQVVYGWLLFVFARLAGRI
jgi:uncharacterized SAM-binding protein YcdF (DUF218 family)